MTNQMQHKASGARIIGLLLILSIALSVALPASAASTGVVRNPNGGTYVNVRSTPSYDADVVTRLSVGTVVDITGSTGVWYSVWVEGIIGYIHSNFLSVSGGGGGGGGTSGTATVNNGPLNMREAPSMRARVITQLPTGYRVNVISVEGTWTQIQVSDGIGYVVSSYLTFSGGSTPAPKPPVVTPDANASIRTTNGGNLNLRAYGSSAAAVLGSYGNGSRVRVLTQGASWCRVQAGDQIGYMSSQYLVLDGGGTPSPTPGTGYDAVVNNPGSGQSLNLRAQPSTDAASLGQYQNGTYVRVLGVGTEWHRVSVNGKEGYMMAKYVRINSSGATPHRTVRGGAGGYVNLRLGAGYNYDVTMRVTNGSAVSVEIPYPTWSKVIVRQGSGYTTGYMLNTFIQ